MLCVGSAANPGVDIRFLRKSGPRPHECTIFEVTAWPSAGSDRALFDNQAVTRIPPETRNLGDDTVTVDHMGLLLIHRPVGFAGHPSARALAEKPRKGHPEEKKLGKRWNEAKAGIVAKA